MGDRNVERVTEGGRASGPSPDAARVAAVRAFLPSTQLRRIARLGADGDRTALERSWGAVLTVDVSGFSALAERHAKEGARGIEALSEIVHVFFGAITDCALRRGGDVLYHAGDAVCALFPADTEEERGEACRRAVAAALEAHARLEPAAISADVRLRSAVGEGETCVWEVGGQGGAWVLMVQGPAVLENARTDRLAIRGAVTVSEAVWQRLGPDRAGAREGGGVFRVTKAGATAAYEAPAVVLLDSHRDAIVRSLPPAVRSRFEAGDPPPVAEFRPVSTFFASLPGIDIQDPRALPRLQEAVRALQSELARLGSPQLEVLGDKGLGFLGVFGLPPHAHDDDAVRAIDAALAVRAGFAARGMKAAIGVATGVVWAGPAGAAGRLCYDVVGSVSILAARLMQAAGQDGVLACGQTRRLAARSVDFVDLPAIPLKGFAAPQPVWRPIGRRTGRARVAPRVAAREAELARVALHIDTAVEGRGGSVIVEAEPGMGKSVLLQAARALAIERGVVVLDGAADSIEVATPYFALRGAVLDLLQIPPGSPVATARELALSRVGEDAPELAWLAPLLDAIVPLDLPESEETAQIIGTTRAERLGDLLVSLVRARAARGPVIWSLEDLHWADRASWSLSLRLVEEVPALLLLATTRPMPSPPPEHAKLTNGGGRESIVLHDLPAAALGDIVAMRLGVPELPAALIALLAARADGNPFFAEEIALAAREAGGLAVVEGQVEIVRPLETLDLPNSITGVITSRMDRLAAAERSALRCAAVLGRSFEIRTLAALLDGTPLAEVTELALRLADLTFLDPDPGAEARGGWRFRHSFLHETAYSLVTFAERRGLHRAAAEAIEAAPDTELASVTALLAHHWEIAERPERAAHFHGLAGVQAIEADANLECVEHLTKALRFDEAARGPLAVDLTRARWGRMLTEASYSLTQPDAARMWGDKTFRWSGLRTPTHLGHVLTHVVQHVWRRYVPARQADEETRARYAESLNAASTLQTVALFAGDQIAQLGLAFYSDVVSRSCDPSIARPMAQGTMGFILIIVGMHEVGVRDMVAAVRMADELGDRPTQMSAKVILGLALSGLGRNEEALAPLHDALRLAERVGSGLWRHRALFQSGEPHYHLGDLDVADDLFDRCAAVARKVEPPVAGLSRAMQAACALRAGKSPDVALALLARPDGLVFAEPGSTLYGLVGLGVHAWALVLAGRHAEAVVSARKCLALIAKEDAYGFARAVDGHAHSALALTRLWELRRADAPGAEALPPIAELERDATKAAAGLARLAKRWPTARPVSFVVSAYQHRLRGKTSQARAALECAVSASEAMKQPWERAVALRILERDHGRVAPELAALIEAHGLRGVGADTFPL